MPDHLHIEIADKDLAILKNMKVADLIKQIKLYPIVTRKVVVICPKRPNHDEETEMYAIANEFIGIANQENWDVKPLIGNDASQANILDALNNWNADWLVYFGHSLNTYIPGQSNNQLQFAITPLNANVLSNRTASVTACSTLLNLGQAAVNSNCVAYLGYKGFFSLWWGGSVTQDFRSATNAANVALLKGCLYKDAKQTGWDAWNAIWINWSNLAASNPQISPLMTADMLANRDNLDFLGNPKAVARPIGIVVLNP